MDSTKLDTMNEEEDEVEEDKEVNNKETQEELQGRGKKENKGIAKVDGGK
jgi:hypothetical protein